MTSVVGPDTILATFVMFCRIGACLMLLPGFGSPRVPMQVRLFLAVAITLALAPLLVFKVEGLIRDDSPVAVLGLIASETLVGSIFGLMARMFFLALQFAGGAIGLLIGMSNTPDGVIDEQEPQAALTSLLTLTAVVLLFATDLHWDVLRALAESYAAIPVAKPLPANFGVIKIVDSLTDAFFIALRICAPFLVYSLTVNLMFGILGKLTPQISVYFISLPFVLAGGGIVLYFTSAEFLRIFITGFAEWLARV